ncbi:MAG: SEL1-like repeat protein, partial [Clostridia bacterium]|nr:SEL1-like repeat protein [Clostridia bacterium]
METNWMEMMDLFRRGAACYQRPEEEAHDEGFQLLLEAAENGVPQACKMLGLLYISGQYAPYPDKDEALAVRWWRMAAENGDEEAMYWLGQCYEEGIGVEVNEEEARIWKRFAIANGFEDEEGKEESPAEPEKTEPIQPEPAKRKKRRKEAQQNAKKEVPVKVEKTPEALPKKIEKVEEIETVPEVKSAETAERAPEKPAAKGKSPLQVVEKVMQKTQHQRKEASKKHEEEEAEAARFAREEEEARRISNQYQLKMGLGGTICCLLLLWIVLLLLLLIFRSIFEGNMWIFWVLALVAMIPAALFGYELGVKKAQERIEQVAEYRKSAFYHAHGCELGQMNRRQHWCYKLYRSLAKNYYPVTYRTKLDLPQIRGYRGCLYTNWIYQSDQEQVQPEFVIVTEKAVYVVRAVCLTGRLQGDLADTAWALYSDGEKDLTAKRLPNLVDENAHNIRVIKEDLIQYFDLPLER